MAKCLNLNMENSEDSEFISECVMCTNRSIPHICDDCKKILKRNGITNVNTIADYNNYYLTQVDEHIQRKVRQAIQYNNL